MKYMTINNRKDAVCWINSRNEKVGDSYFTNDLIK